MGGYEPWALVREEPTLKYHPDNVEVLTLARNPGWEHCMVGSLTGAVSSERVTEEREGTLSMVGNHAKSAKARRVLDCETYMSSRNESWS